MKAYREKNRIFLFRNVFALVIVAIFTSAAFAQQGPVSTTCPSKAIGDILNDPFVQASYRNAMTESNVGMPNEREVGANIIQKYQDNPVSGKREYFYEVALVHGDWYGVNLPDVRESSRYNHRLVATFHTHPGPKGNKVRTLPDGTEEEIVDNHEPSGEDESGAKKRGVPAFIVWGTAETPVPEIYNDPPANPRKMSWECPKPSPPGGPSDSISMEANCGDSANDVIKIKNVKAERRIFRAKSDSDWLEIVTTEANKTIAIPGGQEGRFNLTGTCRDCCGGPSRNIAKVSIYEVNSDGSESLPIDTNVTLVCKPNPKDCGSTKGDPHLCSHDGLRYDFHGVGEYVLAKTDGFEVQVRYRAAPNSRFASINAAIAAKIGTTRIGLYAGDPVRLTIDGHQVDYTLADEEFIWLEGGVTIEKDGEFFRIKGDGYLIEATARPDRLGEVFVRIPSGSSSVGLLGNRDGDRKNDLVGSDGTKFGVSVLFEDLYAKFGNSWRVKQSDSLFDYGPSESTETLTDLSFPSRKTSVADIGSDARRTAEALCRKSGIKRTSDLEDCVYDIAVTGDGTFAEDADSGREDHERLEIRETPPTTVETADGVKIEIPAEAIASYPIEVRVSGPAKPHTLMFAAVGSDLSSREANSGSRTLLKGGDQTLYLLAPFKPGDWELRYLTFPGHRNLLLSIPFKSILPQIKITADAAATAGGSLRVTVEGDLSPNLHVKIVPVGSPETLLGSHAKINGGLRETIIIGPLPLTPGEYEIRVSSTPFQVTYARKLLLIERPTL